MSNAKLSRDQRKEDSTFERLVAVVLTAAAGRTLSSVRVLSV
jgi:hypothetical protein